MMQEDRKKVTVLSISTILFIIIVALWITFGRQKTDIENYKKYIDIVDDIGVHIKEPIDNIKDDTKEIFESEEYQLLKQELEAAISTSTSSTTEQ